MLGPRRRPWANIMPAFIQRLMFTVMYNNYLAIFSDLMDISNVIYVYTDMIQK